MFCKKTIELCFTSRQKISLVNVFHVPEIRKKNLISANFWSRKGFKVVLKFDKVIAIKSEMFVRNVYFCDGMFKFNINKINLISTYIVESTSFLWHVRLGHLNYSFFEIYV